MTISNTVFTVFSGIGFILALIPLPWHLGARNVGTCMYMFWTALNCFMFFVNSIIWSGNTTNWAPVWCDICARIRIGTCVAWPACILCIIRRLYHIVSPAVGTTTRSERREIIIDLLITIGIPVLQMLVELVTSDHRFNIFEDYGCSPATYDTPVAYILVWSWPPTIAVVSAGYGSLTIRTFIRRRKEFRGLIAANANMTYSCYWRLVGLASIDFCITIPIALSGIIFHSMGQEVHPWVSWADTHRGYSRVDQVPRISITNPVGIYTLEVTRWAAVLCAIVFFGFFGFAEEAKKNYRLWMRFIRFPTPFSTPRQWGCHLSQALPRLFIRTASSTKRKFLL